MILLVSAISKAKDCALALEQASHEPVELCSNLQKALEELENQEFSAVILDQLLLDSEPNEDEPILKHVGSAIPVYVNFAIAGVPRVVRELRFAWHRRKRELATAKKEAAQALREEMNDTLTALLLSCEMALQVADVPEQAHNKLRDVEALAGELKVKLGGAVS